MKIVFSNDADELPCPACARCGRQTRLLGIEPHPTIARTDLRTFICGSCDDVQTENVPLDPSFAVVGQPAKA
jgi:hypothetical protein